MENGTAERPAADAPKKPKLTRLKIESFRNVEPCELRFGDGFNVLLGLNAAGKTTLLELIAAALSFDFSKLEKEAFAVEYDLEFSTGSIEASVRSERLERSPIDDPMNQMSDPVVFDRSVRLRFRFTSPAEAWTVCADSSSIWPESKPDRKRPLRMHLGTNGPGLLLRATAIDFRESSSRAYVAELWSWQYPRRFDEALDMFRGITSPTTWLELAVAHEYQLNRRDVNLRAKKLLHPGDQDVVARQDKNETRRRGHRCRIEETGFRRLYRRLRRVSRASSQRASQETSLSIVGAYQPGSASISQHLRLSTSCIWRAVNRAS